ncbi:MAG TPA: tetratricopeptide repeat protein [Gemmataceae bacterium]|nr:tetratricopeptide repeat protein [Gemmataceae bacterium]
MTTARWPGRTGGGRDRRALPAACLLLAGLAVAAAGGCKADAQSAAPQGESLWSKLSPLGAPKAPDPPVESFVLRADGLAPARPPAPDSPEAKLAGARDLFRREEYAEAERLYRAIADNHKAAAAVTQEALYYEAECLRLQGDWPKAADTYNDLLTKFNSQNPYREQAIQHMFDIANFWLNDVREEMRESREKAEGKRWFVGGHFVNWDKRKPFLDEEGRAIEKLEQVRYNDIEGPLADKALFMAGSVKLFHENYRDADHYFSQIAEKHPNSPLAAQAVELAIFAKHMSTGGSDYDGRKVAEARKLVQVALTNYPQLVKDKQDFLIRQLEGINLQQAEKDFKMAEFWRRTGHPGSAYFYYELVRRRYPDTRYAKLSLEKMDLLRVQLEKKQGGASGLPAPPAGAPPAPGGAPAAPEQGPPPRTLPPGG